MKFIVDRKTWYRGQTAAGSCLLRESGQRCCIGFVASQAGISDEKLLNRPAIHSTKGWREDALASPPLPAWMYNPTDPADPSGDLGAAYACNDDPDLSDADREANLKLIFAAHGDEIEFIN